MFAVNDFNIFTPVWKLPRQIFVQRNDAWVEVNELHNDLQIGLIKSWIKVWNRNYFGAVSQQHPFWQYAYNYNFTKMDDTLSWGTYWSTSNAGNYVYPSSGILRLNIGAFNTTDSFGDCYLEPTFALQVSPGQTYTHSVYVEGRGGTTYFSLRAYTNTTESTAQKAATGRGSFETAAAIVAGGTTISQTVTIPAGHTWVRPYLYIYTNTWSGANNNYYRFSNWSFQRTA